MASMSNPAARNPAIRRWISIAPGVVSRAVSSIPGRPAPIVPISAHRSPQASATRWVTLVFPFVPVTATTDRSRDGSP